MLTGDSDQLVPPSHMKRLFELAVRSAGKVFYSVYGGTHNDTWEVAGEEYYRVSPARGKPASSVTKLCPVSVAENEALH